MDKYNVNNKDIKEECVRNGDGKEVGSNNTVLKFTFVSEGRPRTF